MRILLRADGSQQIGMGHVVRTLTLAKELMQTGHDVLCVGRSMKEGVGFAESFRDVPSRETHAALGPEDAQEILSFQPDGVVVDGYCFDKTFFTALEAARVPYAVIDDTGEMLAPSPTVVINQNPNAHESLYSKVKLPTKLLLGLEFALIREELRELAKRPRDMGSSIVIGFGGTDPAGLSAPVASHLLGQGRRIAIHEKFRTSPLKLNPERTDFFSSASFVYHLAKARIAVLGAGSSLWEAAALGIPTVAVVVADNQRTPSQSALDGGLVDGLVNALNEGSERKIAQEVGRTVSLLLETATNKRSTRINLDGARKAALAIVGSFEQYRAMIV